MSLLINHNASPAPSGKGACFYIVTEGENPQELNHQGKTLRHLASRRASSTWKDARKFVLRPAVQKRLSCLISQPLSFTSLSVFRGPTPHWQTHIWLVRKHQSNRPIALRHQTKCWKHQYLNHRDNYRCCLWVKYFLWYCINACRHDCHRMIRFHDCQAPGYCFCSR